MTFQKLWLTAIINPAQALDELRFKPAPRWGLYAVLIRFVGVSLTSGCGLCFSSRYLPKQPKLCTMYMAALLPCS